MAATKDLELIGSHHDLRKSSIVRRIYVEGYDTTLSPHDLVISMKKHFASCGEVLHVYIPGYRNGLPPLNRFALIFLRGEGAEDKALELSGGSLSEGHKLVVKPYPFRAKHLNRELARTRSVDNSRSFGIYVDGYDTSLPVDYLESKLSKHFSRCGRVTFVAVPEEEDKAGVAFLKLKGMHAIEKALKLGRCHVKGLENVKVCGVANPPKDEDCSAGMAPVWSWPPEFDLSVMDDATAPEDPNLPKPPPLMFSEEPPTLKNCYAPEDPSLPKPWKALVDRTTGFKYFWNTETNVTQYKRPLGPSSNYNLRKRVRGG